MLAALLASLASLPAAEVDFARDVQPVLATKCVRCHGPRKQEGGLRLDLRSRARQGGDTGPALGKTGELLRRVTSGDDNLRMPPGGEPLAAPEVDRLRAWIEKGAPWPDSLAGKDPFAAHWAFRPVKPVAAPAAKEEFRTYAIKDRAESTAAAWLGLTLGCAGCHSHQYDPVSLREYYAFFNATDPVDVPVPGGKAPGLKAAPRETRVQLRGGEGVGVKPRPGPGNVPRPREAVSGKQGPGPVGEVGRRRRLAEAEGFRSWSGQPRVPRTPNECVPS